MTSPLNPVLFSRLREEFGRVQISQEGIAASTRHAKEMFGDRLKLQISSAGEYYRVNCPYCNDSRGRLWVNHLWGVPDEITRSKNLWLAICYNEDCLSTQGRSLELYDRVLGFKNAKMRNAGPIVILQGSVEEQVLKEVPLPGFTLRLDHIPDNERVIQYVRSRGFDPVELGEMFGVSYCLDANSQYRMAHGRIIIPVIMRNMTVGWQGRFVGDIDWKAAGIPKYYNLPNMPRRLMLYNFDKARENPYVVVTEGPLDAWRVGEPAVAAFGKHLSQPQIRLVCENWEGGAVIILLDGDAWADTEELTERFHAEQYKGAVIPVRLPQDQDPGKLTRTFLWECIDDECQKVGVDLLTLKRSEVNDHVCQPRHAYRFDRTDGSRGRHLGPQQPVSEYSFDSPRDAAAGTGLPT